MNNLNRKEFVSNSPEETYQIAKNFSEELKPGDIVALIGNLGTGKTIFVKGICAGLNAEQNPISPTFSIINKYKGKYKIYHFDFFRIMDIKELYDIGFEEYFSDKNICLIEWADMFPEILPQERIEVKIELGENESQRKIVIVKQ